MTISSNTQYQTISLNSRDSSIFKNTNQIESSDTKVTDEVEINARNEYTVYEEKEELVREIRNEYYEKVVAIDKTFANPAQHIWDKYYNSDSPYFRDDLSKEERVAAYYNESNYLKYGENAGVYHGDALFKGISLNGNVENAEKKVYQREQVSEQFNKILAANNITIPDDTTLRFTIDPYTYKVDVSGTDDLELISLLENLLDEGNASELFLHIKLSKSGNNTQFTQEKIEKNSLYHDIEDETGYKLDELEIIDGKFMTENGIDIFEIYKQSVQEGTSVPEEFKSFVIGDRYEKLEELAQNGFDSVPDLVLSIDYQNGSFYDVGQSQNFGVGETEWIEELKDKYEYISSPNINIYA